MMSSLLGSLGRATGTAGGKERPSLHRVSLWVYGSGGGLTRPTLCAHFDTSLLLLNRLAHHHQAVQFRRTQIRGSDSSEDDEDEDDDIEWGPATEL